MGNSLKTINIQSILTCSTKSKKRNKKGNKNKFETENKKYNPVNNNTFSFQHDLTPNLKEKILVDFSQLSLNLLKYIKKLKKNKL